MRCSKFILSCLQSSNNLLSLASDFCLIVALHLHAIWECYSIHLMQTQRVYWNTDVKLHLLAKLRNLDCEERNVVNLVTELIYFRESVGTSVINQLVATHILREISIQVHVNHYFVYMYTLHPFIMSCAAQQYNNVCTNCLYEIKYIFFILFGFYRWQIRHPWTCKNFQR